MPPATDANDLSSLLKLDMDNACNERILSVFLNRVRTASQNYLDGPSDAMSSLQNSDLVRDVFSLMQMSNKVTI